MAALSLRLPVRVILLLAAAACTRFPEITQRQVAFRGQSAPPLAPIETLVAEAADDPGADAGRAGAMAAADTLRAKAAGGLAPQTASDAVATRADDLRAAALIRRDADETPVEDPARLDDLRRKADALRAAR